MRRGEESMSPTFGVLRSRKVLVQRDRAYPHSANAIPEEERRCRDCSAGGRTSCASDSMLTRVAACVSGSEA